MCSGEMRQISWDGVNLIFFCVRSIRLVEKQEKGITSYIAKEIYEICFILIYEKLRGIEYMLEENICFVTNCMFHQFMRDGGLAAFVAI